MPTIILDKKRILKELGRDLSTDELEDLLASCKCEIKGERDENLICEITTDRVDCFSTEGIIRAFKGLLGIEKGLVNLEFFYDSVEVQVDKSVSSIRPYVVMATVRGVKLDPRALESIIMFQEILHESLGRNRRKASIGLYDLSKISNKIFYKCLPLSSIKFTPLDKEEELDGYTILAETEKGKLYRKLVPEDRAPVLIDSDGKYLSMVPIINSQEAKVTVNTRDILIDSTGFDRNFLRSIVSLVAYILSFYGGKIGFIKHIYPDSTFYAKFENRFYELDPVEAEEILSIDLKKEELEDLLLRSRYGFSVSGNKYIIEVPFYRIDVLGAIDIIEDLAIAKGYSKIVPKPAQLNTRGKLNEKSILSKIVKEIFNGMGFQEIANYIICNSELQTVLVGLNKEDIGLIYLENPISKEFDCVRANIFPCILDFLSKNRGYSYPQKVYELGEVMFLKGSHFKREFRLSSIIVYNEASFEDIHAAIYSFFKAFGLELKLKENNLNFLIKGRRANILFNGEAIGWIGELNPEISARFSLYQPIVASELNLEPIIKFKFSK